jgi:hypothetical protein
MGTISAVKRKIFFTLKSHWCDTVLNVHNQIENWSKKFAHVSEVLAASIIRVMMEPGSTSEISVNFYQTTSQMTVIFNTN